ncbi:histidine kinase [Flavobacteriaceae bacterium MAR_2010_72]|nr:histidine kinase [Flavobacteriaceae bacterium MAR_2010_72]TVZ59906.1 histidine kinase [Flavobacteriaceae bacterium MAR_2010_105]
MAFKKVNWVRIFSKVGLHVLFWVLILTYFAWGFGLDVNPKQSFLNALFFIPGHLIMVYTLLYFLVPKFLLKRRFLPFFIGFVILVMICALYTVIAQLSVSSNPSLSGANITVGRNILPFIHVGAIAASIKLLKHWYFQRQLTIEAEQQKTIAELKLLKAQLHPHFLFNTLNNLYSHTLDASPKSPEIVMKLSGLLRFMIYESNSARIPLSAELELLQSYISLEQLRYGDRLEVSITISGAIEKFQIAPLLMLPFLENAFKHGTSRQIDQCWISFDLAIEEHTMRFKLVNSIDPIADHDYGNLGGLGLQNVKRRLQLLYKDQHNLQLVKLDEVFVVTLDVTLEALEDKYKDILVLNTENKTYAV